MAHSELPGSIPEGLREHAGGEGRNRLTDHPARDAFHQWSPDQWSPDGTRIAFVPGRDQPIEHDLPKPEIYVIKVDGSGLTNLTKNHADDVFTDNMAWSPDRNLIAFWSNRDGNSEIYLMNADGSNQTRLTNHPPGILAHLVAGRTTLGLHVRKAR